MDAETFSYKFKKYFVSKIVLTFHCSNFLVISKHFVNCQPFASNFQKVFSILNQEQLFLVVGQNNFEEICQKL